MLFFTGIKMTPFAVITAVAKDLPVYIDRNAHVLLSPFPPYLNNIFGKIKRSCVFLFSFEKHAKRPYILRHNAV